MLKKYRFKPFALIVALTAILILPVLANAQDTANDSPPSMEKCMRVTGGNQAKCTKRMAAFAKGQLGNATGAKSSPLCKINPRHLTKEARIERMKRCRS